MYSQLQIQQFVPLAPPPRDGTNYNNHLAVLTTLPPLTVRSVVRSCPVVLHLFPPYAGIWWRRPRWRRDQPHNRQRSPVSARRSAAHHCRRCCRRCPLFLPRWLPPLTTTQGERGGTTSTVLPLLLASVRGGRGVTRTHAVTTDQKSQGGRLVLTLPLTIFDRHPRHCAARHPQQQH